MKKNVVATSCLLAAIFLAAETLFLSSALAQDGKPSTVGTNPFRVAFDGANIWVTSYGSNSVTKLRASDGAIEGTFEVTFAPYGAAFDGTNIWVTTYSTNNVTKVLASDGNAEGKYTVGL